MKNIKGVIIVIILFLAGVAAVLGVKVARTYFSGAAGGSAPVNVRVLPDVSAATITWQSNKSSMGVVEYGANQANLLLRAPETSATTTHRVVLSPLKPATIYYFRIRIGDEIYDNNGIPFSFRTKERTAKISTAPAPSIATVTATPTRPAATASGTPSQCNLSKFKEALKNQDLSFDFDHNGVVNTKDWLICLKKTQ